MNKQLLRHKIILVLDDRGKISCHKVNLCFMYFDPSQCVNYLNEFIERNEQNGTSIEPGWESRLDVSAADIVIQGSNPTRVSRKQVIENQIFFRIILLMQLDLECEYFDGNWMLCATDTILLVQCSSICINFVDISHTNQSLRLKGHR